MARRPWQLQSAVSGALLAASGVALGTLAPVAAAADPMADHQPVTKAKPKKVKAKLEALPDIDASAMPTFTYQIKRRPEHSKVFLQRAKRGAWTDLVPLRSKAGTVSVPAVPLGLYRYRIEVRSRGEQLDSSAVRKQRVFGFVTLADLLGLSPESGGTVTIAGTPFAYVSRPDSTVVSLDRTTCVAASVTIGNQSSPYQFADDGEPAVDVPADTIRRFDDTFALDSPVRYALVPTTANRSFYANGVFYCYTKEGDLL